MVLESTIICRIKRHIELLWEEFRLPIWVTEFDWNANNDVEMGDHTVHAEQIHNFYTLMFSLEVFTGTLILTKQGLLC